LIAQGRIIHALFCRIRSGTTKKFHPEAFLPYSGWKADSLNPNPPQRFGSSRIRGGSSMRIKSFWNLLAPTLSVAGTLAFALIGQIAQFSPRPVMAADKAAKPPETAPAGWDRQAAARYLDSREDWWQGWDHAKKDHGTMCISCHTQAPYGLARPALRSELGEQGPSAQEQVMLASIDKRVRGWKDMQPFYSDALSGAGKEVESRNAEAVLNALILSNYDTHQGHLSEATRMAFDNAWALQSQTGPATGAWIWQNFQYTPWESPESEYHGAALMAVAVGKAPDRYKNDPKIAANLASLSKYLRDKYNNQPLVNKLVTFWASARIPGLMTKDERTKLLADLATRQQQDGGWSLTDLGTWQRRDKTPLETRSDGYATGLVVLALEESAAKREENPQVVRGIQWLIANQDRTTGAWPAWSLNKNRDPKTPVGQFMSDAATSYAVLALEARR
jgi:mono/diheme cytochrome c family protein